MATPGGPLFAAGVTEISKSGQKITFLPDAHNDWNTLPLSQLLVSVKVQSSETQTAVKPACGAADAAGRGHRDLP